MLEAEQLKPGMKVEAQNGEWLELEAVRKDMSYICIGMINWQQYAKYMKKYLTFSSHELMQMVCIFALIFILTLFYRATTSSLRLAVRKSGYIFAFAVWMALMIGVTLLNRHVSPHYLVRFDVSGVIRSILNGNYNEQYHAISNISLFVPYGFLLPFNIEWCSTWWKHFLVCFISSLLIELEQLITGLGTWDVIDLITNLLGGIIGYLVFKSFKLFYKIIMQNFSNNKISV